jgi:peptidoglycan/xylan/chitin deacetylase (PgdA/CDA1 family)
MTVSEAHGLTSTFFFIATGERTAMGGNYDLASPWISRRLVEIHRRGHEIGLHGSFDSLEHPTAITQEVRRLRSIAARLEIQQETFGGRQHFLRWDNATTWPAYEIAGLSYDTSVGYAEDIGFRAGTCRDYPAYDLIARRPLNLVERPLHVMDGAIAPYLQFPSTDAVARVLAMAAQCRRFRGSLVVLWHNTSIASNRAKRQYRELIEALASSA